MKTKVYVRFESGEYYGYPPCCIKSFDSTFPRPTNYIPNNRTGFLPCVKCSNRVLNGEITIADLITNRKCVAHFPDGGKGKTQDK
jgi:hypothetical protein